MDTLTKAITSCFALTVATSGFTAIWLSSCKERVVVLSNVEPAPEVLRPAAADMWVPIGFTLAMSEDDEKEAETPPPEVERPRPEPRPRIYHYRRHWRR